MKQNNSYFDDAWHQYVRYLTSKPLSISDELVEMWLSYPGFEELAILLDEVFERDS